MRTAYLQTESEKNTEAALETTLEISWQALQAVSGFVPVASAGFQYAAAGLANMDMAKNVKETHEKKSWSWGSGLGTVLATAAAVLGTIAIFVFPPLAIPAFIVAGVSIAYAVGKGIKEHREKIAHRKDAFNHQANQQAAALDEHLRSKTKLREQYTEQHDKLSSEAKMEMLLT